MTWYESTYEETRTLSCSAEAALQHFADPKAVITATKGVESSTVDGEVMHLVLEEEDHAGVMKFKGDYRCRYLRDGDTVRWETLEGNVDQSGEARVEATENGCTLFYTETVKLDLDLPALMAPMLKPVIGAMLSHEVKDYVKRMVADLS